MVRGPFNGPRPFVTSSITVEFIFSSDPGFTDVEVEQRLRNNGFARSDVKRSDSKPDSRVQVTVITSEEEMSYAGINRIIGQVRSEANVSISDRSISVFCI